MNFSKKIPSKKICLKGLMVTVSLIFAFSGCATAPSTFDKGIEGPQMIVDPQSVSLGVVSLAKTPIVFKGMGFEPEDSVFINLLNVKKGDKMVHIPIAAGDVDKEGRFVASVGTIEKVNELLNAKIGSNEKLETVIIVSGPPIPAGTYTARAVSMESDKIAVCKITFKEPLGFDVLKDLLGQLLGKVKKI
jgi:hypothetical protein